MLRRRFAPYSGTDYLRLLRIRSSVPVAGSLRIHTAAVNSFVIGYISEIEFNIAGFLARLIQMNPAAFNRLILANGAVIDKNRSLPLEDAGRRCRRR